MNHFTTKRFPWKKINVAINGLLDSIPEVTSQIAPFGLAVSEYFYCNRKGPDTDYLVYRKVRASKYIYAKKYQKTEFTFEPLQSYQDFLKTYEFWPELNIEMEMTSLLLNCFRNVIVRCGFYIKITDDSYFKYRLGNTSDQRIVRFVLKQTLIREFTTEDDYFYKAEIWGPYFNNHGVDNYPFYVRVFKEMKIAELDFVYRCDYLKFLKRLNAVRFTDWWSASPDHATYDPEQEVIKSICKENKQMFGKKFDFDNAFNELSQSGPTEVLRAYHEVYGCWPDGWPLRKEDYL